MDGKNLAKNDTKKMEDLQKQLSKKHPKLKIEIEVSYDSIRERVSKLSKKNKIKFSRFRT